MEEENITFTISFSIQKRQHILDENEMNQIIFEISKVFDRYYSDLSIRKKKAMIDEEIKTALKKAEQNNKEKQDSHSLDK